jgi:hypothetical protein
MGKKWVWVVVIVLSTATAWLYLREKEETRELPPPRALWVDYASDDFDGGSGTETNPYRIATAEQLAYLAKTVSEGEEYKNAYFEVTTDIDLAGKDWVPIGESTNEGKFVSFQGHFNGGGKTIINLEIWQPRTYMRALFGLVKSAYLKNIVLKNVSISEDKINAQTSFVAAIAASVHHSSITNCSVTGTVDGRR